jgi:WD40 repeat protein
VEAYPSPEQDLVITCSWGPGGSDLINGRTGELVIHLADQLARCDWNNDGSRFAVVCIGSSSVWDAKKLKRVWFSEDIGANTGMHPSRSMVAWSPIGNVLAIGRDTGTITFVDSSTGKVLEVASGHTDAVWSIAWSNDGSRIASASGDGTVRIWDACTTTELLKLSGSDEGEPFFGVKWSPNGRRLAAVSGDGNVYVWGSSELELPESSPEYLNEGTLARVRSPRQSEDE